MHPVFWLGDPRKRDELDKLGADGIILKQISEKWSGEAWTRPIWLKIGTGGGRL